MHHTIVQVLELSWAHPIQLKVLLCSCYSVQGVCCDLLDSGWPVD